jgi:hypothetical protein
MQMRRVLRMPIFVAKKSQYRNCQQRERVAFSRGCAGDGEAEILRLGSRSTELARRNRKIFLQNELICVSESRAARCVS